MRRLSYWRVQGRGRCVIPCLLSATSTVSEPRYLPAGVIKPVRLIVNFCTHPWAMTSSRLPWSLLRRVRVATTSSRADLGTRASISRDRNDASNAQCFRNMHTFSNAFVCKQMVACFRSPFSAAVEFTATGAQISRYVLHCCCTFDKVILPPPPSPGPP